MEATDYPISANPSFGPMERWYPTQGDFQIWFQYGRESIDFKASFDYCQMDEDHIIARIRLSDLPNFPQEFGEPDDLYYDLQEGVSQALYPCSSRIEIELI